MKTVVGLIRLHDEDDEITTHFPAPMHSPDYNTLCGIDLTDSELGYFILDESSDKPCDCQDCLLIVEHVKKCLGIKE